MTRPLPNLTKDLDVLIDEDTLDARIGELGAQIQKDYAGHKLVLVGVLKGSLPFMADLARRIDLPETIFPESPAYWQQRIILDNDGAIFDYFADARAL